MPEHTQNPGNFRREFCSDENAEFIAGPLPDIPDTTVWKELMALWRKMRAVHKSSHDPSDDEIKQYENWVVAFQEKIFGQKWVPIANQIHRLTHMVAFMKNKSVRSIGAYSLEDFNPVTNTIIYTI